MFTESLLGSVIFGQLACLFNLRHSSRAILEINGHSSLTSRAHALIGASLSEPHTNPCYEKIAVLMYVCKYVCMYMAIRRPRVYNACAYI